MKGGMTIGVTGPPCAGKSLAARLIASGEALEIPGELIKADDLGHAVLERPETREALRGRFGEEIFRDPDPVMVRREIAARVFDSREDLAWLERLVHPEVSREVEAAIARNGGRVPLVVEAALLFAGGLDRLCDRVVVIDAPFAVRLERAMKRGWSRGELERREKRLAPLFDAAPQKEGIVIVPNDGDVARLRGRLRMALTIGI